MSAHQPIHPTQEQIDSAVQEIRAIMQEAGPLHFARMAALDERIILALGDQLESLRAQIERLTELRDALTESLESMGGIPMTDRLAAALNESRTVIVWQEVVPPQEIDAAWNEYATRFHDMISEEPEADLEVFSAGFRAGVAWSRTKDSKKGGPHA